ncbi:transposable element Tc1 transposase [Trichonephila clavipes]|nr:transposable element Tc1 transposase [Trichonephila clavipes]
MDDSTWTLLTAHVQRPLKREDVTRMEWLAPSSNLNPIEHVWDALGRHFAAQLHPPGNTQLLKQSLIKECALLHQELLDNLVLSMESLGEAAIAVGEVICHIFACCSFSWKDNNV